jgi:signal transduction histidine kinase/CheY-like chemotaxis protein
VGMQFPGNDLASRLEEESAFLQTIIETMPSTAVFVVDDELRVRRVLGAPALAAAGLTPEFYLGRTIGEFALPENRQSLETACREAILGRRACVEVERNLRRFEVNTLPLRGALGRRAVVVSHEVTERDRLRARLRAQERLVTIGTLAAGVGHEINNPLSYVMANVEIVTEELRSIAGPSPSGRFRELLEQLAEVRDGAERIRKIVRGLRSFSREEAAPVPTDVHATIEVSINMAMHELRPRATIVRDLAAVPLVLADDARLAQVLVNLLVNAAQAFGSRPMDQNHVYVSTHTGEDGEAVIEVRDDGPGMDAATAAHVFEPFFTTKPVGQGTGLGLSISRDVVTSLGGKLECETAQGKGATFRVVLLPAREPTETPRETARPSLRVTNGAVLVIDDDPLVTASIARILGGEHQVTECTDPRAALTMLLEDREFDVVFCDVTMPHLTGLELYKRLCAAKPDLGDRFVFMTGGLLQTETSQFLEELPNERLEKPLGVQNLRAMVRRFVAANRRA